MVPVRVSLLGIGFKHPDPCLQTGGGFSGGTGDYSRILEAATGVLWHFRVRGVVREGEGERRGGSMMIIVMLMLMLVMMMAIVLLRLLVLVLVRGDVAAVTVAGGDAAADDAGGGGGCGCGGCGDGGWLEVETERMAIGVCRMYVHVCVFLSVRTYSVRAHSGSACSTLLCSQVPTCMCVCVMYVCMYVCMDG